MVTLDSLPEELILAVVDHVTPRCLYDLNLVNRHLHDLTLEHLYAAFSGEDTLLFLRTIALASSNGRRDVARLVKNVRWETMSICSIGGVFPSSDVWAIAQAYRLLGREGPDLYDYFTRYGVREPVNQHWYLEFFLAFLPNVKELSVSGAWQWNDHNYWFMNTAAQLNRVQINGPLRIENIHPLLNMPSLRSLDLEEVIVMRQETGVSFEWHQPVRRINLKEASSGLEELRLGSSYVSTSSLVTVINTTRALRSFTYEHSRNELSLRRIRFDFPGLAAALDRHKSSLEHFAMDINLGDLDPSLPWSSINKVSDLEDFDPYIGFELLDSE
jgi:hypothetical protein